MYDMVIVGGGPAGLAAAVNARRRNKQVALVAKEENSSKLVQAHRIDNFLGIPGITGRELAEKLRHHAEEQGTTFIKDEVQSINPDEGRFMLWGRENSFEALSIVLATGIVLGSEIAGETEFVGRGVSYCATCDAMFYKGKTVAMIGYIPEAETEAEFLAELCAQVYYLPQYKLQKQLDSRITIISGKPAAIRGDVTVKELATQAEAWEVDGVFIERSGRPAEQLLPGLELSGGFIVTGQDQATNIPGVFAAGDCTGRPWQIDRAVGQGQVAALGAVQYLEMAKSGSGVVG
ncbi:MAG TPA: FAD-dependent oxidoreductase [Bacillota bacterium]